MLFFNKRRLKSSEFQKTSPLDGPCMLIGKCGWVSFFKGFIIKKLRDLEACEIYDQGAYSRWCIPSYFRYNLPDFDRLGNINDPFSAFFPWNWCWFCVEHGGCNNDFFFMWYLPEFQHGFLWKRQFGIEEESHCPTLYKKLVCYR